jgi:hypothetical protein
MDAFSAFRRRSDARDIAAASDPAITQGLGLAHQRFAVNPSLVRVVYSAGGTTLFIAPGTGTVCFAGTRVAGECTSTAAAKANGLGDIGERTSAAGAPVRLTIAGVLPAGASGLMAV